MNILTTNFSYESMFSYIKSGMLDLDEEDIYILENYVNKWGIRGSKWHKEEFEALYYFLLITPYLYHLKILHL